MRALRPGSLVQLGCAKGLVVGRVLEAAPSYDVMLTDGRVAERVDAADLRPWPDTECGGRHF